MCLGIPGLVQSLDMNSVLRMGMVNFSGIEREVSLALVPEATIGDYVIVHVGYAISVIDRDAAKQTLMLFDEVFATRSDFLGRSR